MSMRCLYWYAVFGFLQMWLYALCPNISTLVSSVQSPFIQTSFDIHIAKNGPMSFPVLTCSSYCSSTIINNVCTTLYCITPHLNSPDQQFAKNLCLFKVCKNWWCWSRLNQQPLVVTYLFTLTEAVRMDWFAFRLNFHPP